MGATAFESDLDRVGIGRERSAVEANLTVSHWPVVQRERDIRLGEAREQTVLQHRLGPAQDLFSGLRHEHQRALPLPFQPDERLRGADPCGHVQIMTAGVRDWRLPAFVNGFHLARIRQAGLFFHR